MTSEKSKLILPSPVISIEEVIEENIKTGLKSHLNALTVVNRIITKGTNILYSRYLNSKLPKHLADYYFGALTELITQEVRAYDPGESVDSMIFNWGEDEEPKVAVLDTWAGYCVDVKKPPPQASSSEGVPSLVSISDSLKGGNLRARSSQAGKRFSTVTQAIKKIIPRNSEFMSAEKEALTFREEAKIEIKKLEIEEEVEDKRLQEARRHIEQKRKFEQQKREEALEEKQKQLELQEKIKNFEKQKKEHGFTMDFEGNIILMNKPATIRKKEPQTYNLDTPLKTIEKPSKGGVTRFQSEEDDKKKLSLMSTPRLVTEEKSDLTKSMKFRNMFDAKPGVMMTMNHHVKSKSQTPISNRMKREDFLKILDNRKNERRAQRLLKMNHMNEIPEEDIGQKRETLEEDLILHIKQISKTNAVDPAVKIHNENDFIQMLVETSDKNQRQNLKTPKSHRERNAVKVLQPQEETHIEIFETRVINYESVLVDAGMKKVDLNKVRPVVPKIQQALDNYNRRLMKQESWGNGAPSRSNAISTPRVSRGTSVEKRTQQKVTTLDHHLAKEPRERITVGQKKAIREKDLAINLDSIANKFAVGSFTTRNPENRQFLIRTSNSKSRLVAGLEKEDSIRQDKFVNKPDMSSINLSKLKANSSTATVAKSLQTARARINS